MTINTGRLKRRIDAVNEASRDPGGGYSRLAFSEADRFCRGMVIEMMKEAALETHTDLAGNIFGSYNPGGLCGYVAAGSHIDTVLNGGAFDGLLGSIAAIEAVQTAMERNVKLKRPLRAAVFADEEGARFGAGLTGSKAVAGQALAQPLESYIDASGVSLASAMRGFGLEPEKILEAAAGAGTYHAFLELHIEQGAVLEKHGQQIGIVSGIKGPYWIRGCFSGQSNHAGGTPMDMRHDALCAAAKLATEVYRIGCEIGGDFVSTVGVLKPVPGGINTIAGKAEYTVDIRDLDGGRRQEGVRRILAAAEDAAKFYRVGHESECIKDEPCTEMDLSIRRVLEAVCKERGVRHMTLSSGPMHDALSMSKICKTGMIFVPSAGGVSHSPKERTDWEDIFQGAQLLYEALVRLAS